MLLGCIADDFTGASDLANTLSRHGMHTVQFVGVPDVAAAVPCEAGVVALKTRSAPRADAVDRSLQALRWLSAQGCSQFFFKYCSTFDSTPGGNIGPVAEALLDALGAPIAVVCPAFPATGRTLYQGHLFVRDRLLSESGMEHHPLTPMSDPDIRRWLSRQVAGDVGLITFEIVRRGAGEIAAALRVEAAAGRRLVVVDALTDDDLRAIGAAAADHSLITGGSGLAMGLPATFRSRGKLGDVGERFTGQPGPAVVLSGSCSTASLAQLRRYLRHHPGLAVDPGALLMQQVTVESACDFVLASAGEAPAIYTSAEPAMVAQAQDRFGRDTVAHAVEAFFGALAAALVRSGITRIAVGGGETSGAVVEAVGFDRLEIGPEIDPGVPALSSRSPTGQRVCLALKSGNFGSDDFYSKALAVLEAQ